MQMCMPYVSYGVPETESYIVIYQRLTLTFQIKESFFKSMKIKETEISNSNIHAHVYL